MILKMKLHFLYWNVLWIILIFCISEIIASDSESEHRNEQNDAQNEEPEKIENLGEKRKREENVKIYRGKNDKEASSSGKRETGIMDLNLGKNEAMRILANILKPVFIQYTQNIVLYSDNACKIWKSRNVQKEFNKFETMIEKNKNDTKFKKFMRKMERKIKSKIVNIANNKLKQCVKGLFFFRIILQIANLIEEKRGTEIQIVDSESDTEIDERDKRTYFDGKIKKCIILIDKWIKREKQLKNYEKFMKKYVHKIKIHVQENPEEIEDLSGENDDEEEEEEDNDNVPLSELFKLNQNESSSDGETTLMSDLDENERTSSDDNNEKITIGRLGQRNHRMNLRVRNKIETEEPIAKRLRKTKEKGRKMGDMGENSTESSSLEDNRPIGEIIGLNKGKRNIEEDADYDDEFDEANSNSQTSKSSSPKTNSKTDSKSIQSASSSKSPLNAQSISSDFRIPDANLGDSDSHLRQISPSETRFPNMTVKARSKASNKSESSNSSPSKSASSKGTNSSNSKSSTPTKSKSPSQSHSGSQKSAQNPSNSRPISHYSAQISNNPDSSSSFSGKNPKTLSNSSSSQKKPSPSESSKNEYPLKKHQNDQSISPSSAGNSVTNSSNSSASDATSPMKKRKSFRIFESQTEPISSKTHSPDSDSIKMHKTASEGPSSPEFRDNPQNFAYESSDLREEIPNQGLSPLPENPTPQMDWMPTPVEDAGISSAALEKQQSSNSPKHSPTKSNWPPKYYSANLMKELASTSSKHFSALNDPVNMQSEMQPSIGYDLNENRPIHQNAPVANIPAPPILGSPSISPVDALHGTQNSPRESADGISPRRMLDFDLNEPAIDDGADNNGG